MYPHDATPYGFETNTVSHSFVRGNNTERTQYTTVSGQCASRSASMPQNSTEYKGQVCLGYKINVWHKRKPFLIFLISLFLSPSNQCHPANHDPILIVDNTKLWSLSGKGLFTAGFYFPLQPPQKH